MSTPHNAAKEGEIAESVLLPGDPLRAKYVAENFLTDAKCYTEVRGMLGFTGLYKGRRVSVQGTGMGMPSLSIYVTELFKFYNVQKAIRIGTAGAISDEINLRDIILAQASSTDSGINTQRFHGMHFAPIADFGLLSKAAQVCAAKNVNFSVGNIASHDLFYDDAEIWRLWRDYGVLGAEMESAELYTLAAKFHRKALAILSVSDHIVKGGELTAAERQTSLNAMIEIALETAVS